MPITTPTTFVLGAGASVDYGFPTGIALRREVLENLGRPFGPGIRPVLGELGHAESIIDEFETQLGFAGFRSVDEFLEHNPEYLEIGNCAMAAVLLPKEKSRRLVPPVGPDHSWYELLATRMMGPHGEGWEDNRVSVVTFNYDRSFEHYFCRILAQRRRVTAERAFNDFTRLRLIHVHGTLGGYPGTGDAELPYDSEPSAENVRRAANRILVISRAKDTNPRFTEARVELEGAQRIYFIGFGFNTDNIRRLQYFNSPVGPAPSGVVVGGMRGQHFTEAEWKRVVEQDLRGRWSTSAGYGDAYTFLRYEVPT